MQSLQQQQKREEEKNNNSTVISASAMRLLKAAAQQLNLPHLCLHLSIIVGGPVCTEFRVLHFREPREWKKMPSRDDAVAPFRIAI